MSIKKDLIRALSSTHEMTVARIDNKISQLQIKKNSLPLRYMDEEKFAYTQAITTLMELKSEMMDDHIAVLKILGED